MSVEFKEFPKMSRFSRDIIISEKIDGTNASIFINPWALETKEIQDAPDSDPTIIAQCEDFTMRAGSRTKWIYPGKQSDNSGFAKWAQDNAEDLFKLGEGHHFGEWWGSGIQRGYGLPKGEKRFSLFNTYRWGQGGKDEASKPECCYVVPVLYNGPFDTEEIEITLQNLKDHGSYASEGFMNPEGIIVWHTAANIGFKRTILNDDIPKSLQK